MRLALFLLLFTSIAHAGSYMRPGVVDNTPIGENAYVQLWNPPGSGKMIHISDIWVGSQCYSFAVLGNSDPLSTNSFPTPNGLSIDAGSGDLYSSGVVLTERSPFIDGGQYLNIGGTPQHIQTPITIGEGTGVMIRCGAEGADLSVTFMWTETAI